MKSISKYNDLNKVSDAEYRSFYEELIAADYSFLDRDISHLDFFPQNTAREFFHEFLSNPNQSEFRGVLESGKKIEQLATDEFNRIYSEGLDIASKMNDVNNPKSSLHRSQYKEEMSFLEFTAMRNDVSTGSA